MVNVKEEKFVGMFSDCLCCNNQSCSDVWIHTKPTDRMTCTHIHKHPHRLSHVDGSN